MGRQPDRLMELQEDLRATADDIAADAERVHEIEIEKTELPADHPRTAALAEETESLIEEMARKARIQTSLIDAAQGEATS